MRSEIMNEIVKQLLEGRLPDRIFPFLWMHGEDEQTLRKYLHVIHDAGMNSVCVESRPHPDFAGEGWWRDMNVVLEEARKLGMHVWILDDSHFPTGYANGALRDAPAELCRQSLVREVHACPVQGTYTLNIPPVPQPWQPNLFEQYSLDKEHLRVFSDDRLLAVLAVREGGKTMADILDVTEQIQDGTLAFRIPAGRWNIQVMYLTRNRGPHRDYINMMDARSCRVLLDAVYEPHYRHYRRFFGNTLAGFFSDEPELGNGHLYEYGKRLYENEDQAWSVPLEERLRKKWGADFTKYLPLLWEQNFARDQIAAARCDYMDAVTRLVSQNFSEQIGDWCRAHGVQYIGHVIEDNGQDTRTGSGLGHFFRAEAGQSMAGIDDIGGQVLPQGEFSGPYGLTGEYRNGLFYHFVLGKLAASAAAVDPRKDGRAMCEIFGNYGWEEGVRLEKYLVDHFLVRGINHFVPHAFSPKPYPDPDCPPHFYAQGNHPLYRHFGELMRYANRLCGLLGSGRVVAPVAVLYHAESEWMGKDTPPEKVAELLARKQIDYTFLPSGVFSEPERYAFGADGRLLVSGREYSCILFPKAEYLPAAAMTVARAWEMRGGKVYFLDGYPQGVYDGENVLPFEAFGNVVPARSVAERLRADGLAQVQLSSANRDLRVLHVTGKNEIFMLVNEGKKDWRGTVTLPASGACYGYNAWLNRLETLACLSEGNNCRVTVSFPPLNSIVIVFDEPARGIPLYAPWRKRGKCVSLNDGWVRTMCRSIEYPDFSAAEDVSLPDRADAQYPKFSGFYRYEREIFCERTPGKALMEITDAHEGVELIINGMRAGIRIAPPFLYDVTGYLHEGTNVVAIEVATTPERELSSLPDPTRMFLGLGEKVVTTPSGLDGKVNLYLQR